MSDANKAEIMPTQKQELTLRAIEVYESLLDRYNTKQIGVRELIIGVRTLVEACGWGIERDTFLMLSEPLLDKVDLKSNLNKTVLVGTDDNTVFIGIIVLDQKVNVVTSRKVIYKLGERMTREVTSPHVFHFNEDKDPAKSAAIRYRDLIDFAISGKGKVKYETIAKGVV